MDPFVAEIRIFAFAFPPRGWAFCAGQLMPISQNTALFSLLGTNYGGDGKSTFALPNLEGSAPMFWGQGPGLSVHDLGETGGTETVTLLESELPFHTHNLNAAAGDSAETNVPTNNAMTRANRFVYATPGPLVQMAVNALTVTGGSLPHNNMQPYLTLNFCIALQGVFPPRG